MHRGSNLVSGDFSKLLQPRYKKIVSRISAMATLVNKQIDLFLDSPMNVIIKLAQYTADNIVNIRC